MPLFYDLDVERGLTHRWMKISKSRNFEDVGLMEEKLCEMGKDLINVRLKELVLKIGRASCRERVSSPV